MLAIRRTLMMFALALVVGRLLLMVGGAEAGWLSRIGRLADDAGTSSGGAMRHGLPGDDIASAFARHMKSLPGDAENAASLAAHATPEGHWRFTNRNGEHYTAANSAEMERVTAMLLPHQPAGKLKLELYVSEDTVFHRSDLISTLPADARLHLLTEKQAFKLARAGGDRAGFTAEIRPHLKLQIGARQHFDEAVWLLSRPLNTSDLRVVALEPGGSAVIPSVPKFDPATKAPLIDRVDPWRLPSALKSLRGQTVVVTGRVEGKTLRFKPEGGAEKTVLVDDLMASARDADVNLVLLQSDKPLQPGGRNWLWQRQQVKGLDEALRRSTLADVLDALGANRGGLLVDPGRSASGRARLDIVPATAPVSDVIGNWAGDIVSQLLGNVVVEAIKVDAVAKERQDELDLRIVPGIPAFAQWTYLVALVLGLIGHAYVFSWFSRLWPAEVRSEYASNGGYQAARLVRFLVLLLLFLPLVGIPAGIWAMLVGMAQQLWQVVTAPFRLIRWLAGKLRFGTG